MAINHEKMLDFIHKQTKLALTHMPVQHFDDGGTVLGGPTQQGPASGTGGNQGGLGNLLGVQNNFQATGAQVQAGTNNAQLNQAYNTAQSGITQQQNVADTLVPGVQTGANAQNQVLNQTLAESQGQGPNPAQAALNQSTGQNIQQTAALMASQRGAGANPGQLATQAAQTGAQTQQNAIGQSATLQAQQQLAAQAQAAGIAGTQINQGQNAVTGS